MFPTGFDVSVEIEPTGASTAESPVAPGRADAALPHTGGDAGAALVAIALIAAALGRRFGRARPSARGH